MVPITLLPTTLLGDFEEVTFLEWLCLGPEAGAINLSMCLSAFAWPRRELRALKAHLGNIPGASSPSPSNSGGGRASPWHQWPES